MTRLTPAMKLAAAVCLCGALTGCFSRPAAQNAPGFKACTLRAEHIWQMNLPHGQRFDASGLFREKSGDLLTESDQQIGVYRIIFAPQIDAVDLVRIPDCFTPAQLAPFAREKFGRYDCEGVTEDDQGRIYLCEETKRLTAGYCAGIRPQKQSNAWPSIGHP